MQKTGEKILQNYSNRVSEKHIVNNAKSILPDTERKRGKFFLIRHNGRKNIIDYFYSIIILVFISPIVMLIAFPCLSCNAASSKNHIIIENLLSRIEKKYANRDFSLNFTQISTLKAINVVDKACGRAFFSYPGKMRWEYQSPEKNEIITDGKNLWIYRPGENQVVKGKAENLFEKGSGGAFLSNISIISKFYKLSMEKTDDEFIYLLMVPKKKIPDIASIHIRISKANDEINRIITFNIYGDTTKLLFTDIKFRHFDNSLFKFVIPPGTDIIFMNK